MSLKGSCHCGNVQLSVPHLTDTATECNCSICSRYAARWGYFTEQQVEVSVGEKGLQAYSYGDNMIAFQHCKNCGCLTHYTSTTPGPEARLAINYRMFGLDVMNTPVVRHFDGADSWKYLD